MRRAPGRFITSPGVLGFAALLSLLTACGDASGEGERRGIVVSAASSLSDAFVHLAGDFEARDSRYRVALNFGSSAALVTQIEAGAPADVFASADIALAQAAAVQGDITEPQPLATNELVVAVPAGGERVRQFADLAQPGVRLVLAAPEVPAGGYAREVLERASDGAGFGAEFDREVLTNLRSEEASVRAVLAKVQLGEADAGIVYRTDLAAAGDEVDAVEIPGGLQVRARYAIAEVVDSDEPAGARAFIEFALSGEGQAVLQQHGFGPAEGP